ncbi:MAG: leucine--tRNA ligase [Oscillospiraceae bacterium]|nr:leucine--tRNA ligase [Oscillospiraceae bacterium]
MERYNHNDAEKKWRQRWRENPIQTDCESKPKHYCLDMFPYPSGSGLHLGHWRGYVLSDVLSRYKILQGYHVLHPMGWDAFGLPAENAAISKGMHPETSTAENIITLKRQLEEISAVYDWRHEINTTDPSYYKWTQWIFARMYEKGLAYEQEMPLNWCPACKVVLANEEAVGGVCERCGSVATKKNLRQWMLKITEYAERLLNDLDTLDWPEKVKKMQADWIGKSHGVEIDFSVQGFEETIRAYTTRVDTLCGATFLVLAPEHPLVDVITSHECENTVKAYVNYSSSRSSVDRMSDKEKTGVFTGCYATNPITGESNMPIWVADYVLADYGTGAIMCVPAHDDRDFEFAKKFNLPIVQVIAPQASSDCEPLSEAFTGKGVLINSGQYSGLTVEEAQEAIANYLSSIGKGNKTINYKLRDWVFSRQRYWGEPIPLVHCEKCGIVVVPDSDLPVKLPEVESYQPTDTGESPLALVDDWVNTACPKCGGPGKRETNTMPQWAGSSWYFLRYPDPTNSEAIADPELLKKWLPVDYYVGGVEHAVLHLLYARFYTKFLFDIGVLDFEEPFTKLFNQGMVTRFGKKMAKSAGNGVSPDVLLPKYGCDVLRMYELFIGPPELDSEWDDSGIEGVARFFNRLWKFVQDAKERFISATPETDRLRNLLVYDITTRIENLSMNTVVSGFMEHTNSLISLNKKLGGLDRESIETVIVLLAPFAPHIAEEMWESIGNNSSVFTQEWPSYDLDKLKEDSITIVLQINGKHRGSIMMSADADESSIVSAAQKFLSAKLSGTDVTSHIYVPMKIVNFITV